MDEYGYEIPTQNSTYRDILSLISEHAIAIPGSDNAEILQSLIQEELKLVKATVEGSLILINAELVEIKKNNRIKSSNITSIK